MGRARCSRPFANLFRLRWEAMICVRRAANTNRKDEHPPGWCRFKVESKENNPRKRKKWRCQQTKWRPTTRGKKGPDVQKTLFFSWGHLARIIAAETHANLGHVKRCQCDYNSSRKESAYRHIELHQAITMPIGCSYSMPFRETFPYQLEYGTYEDDPRRIPTERREKNANSSSERMNIVLVRVHAEQMKKWCQFQQKRKYMSRNRNDADMNRLTDKRPWRM